MNKMTKFSFKDEIKKSHIHRKSKQNIHIDYNCSSFLTYRTKTQFPVNVSYIVQSTQPMQP